MWDGKNARAGLCRPVKLFSAALFLITAIAVFQASPSQARPATTTGYAESESGPPWVRLENNELVIDFSREAHSLPESALFRANNSDWVADGAGYFWVDSINGVSLETAAASIKIEQGADRDGLVHIDYEFSDETDPGFHLRKSVRLMPDGAQLEVQYEITSKQYGPADLAYSLSTPWSPRRDGGPCRYHVPLREEIARFGATDAGGPIHFDGQIILEPWFCVEDPVAGVSAFLVSSHPLDSWSASPALNGYRQIKTVLWNGTLKPGETIKGTYWVAFISGLGMPISAGPKYAAGVVWNSDERGRSYQLETRFSGMPKHLKKFRVFSSLNNEGSRVSWSPTFTRRSLLSPTSLLRVPSYRILRSGRYELEQSIYSSSEHLGYWKVFLETPDRSPQQVVRQTVPVSSEIPTAWLPPGGNPLQSNSSDPIHVIDLKPLLAEETTNTETDPWNLASQPANATLPVGPPLIATTFPSIKPQREDAKQPVDPWFAAL